MPAMGVRPPMVLTLRFKPETRAMPASTATSEAGTRSVTRGHSTRTARHARPTASAGTLRVPRFCTTQASLSVDSMGAVPAG